MLVTASVDSYGHFGPRDATPRLRSRRSLRGFEKEKQMVELHESNFKTIWDWKESSEGAFAQSASGVRRLSLAIS